MSELADLQARFCAGLESMDGGTPDLFRSAGDIGKRFGIYRGNARANTANALGGSYPVVAKIVGEDFFSGLAREYGMRYPSVSGDLNEYGESFAGFLDEFAPAREIAYLADVARLEWRVHRAHYAADVVAFDPARLATVAPEQQGDLMPRLNPACSFMHSAFPLARIWEVNQSQYEGAFEVDFSREPAYVLVYRPRFRVEVMEIPPAAAAFLKAVEQGGTLETALSAAQLHDVAFDLGGWLVEWIASAVIVDFQINGG
ncbi:MAG: DNA-binding domain-containing protein [Betaproteobacteria bacterium]